MRPNLTSLRPAGRDRPPVPRPRCCSCPPCCNRFGEAVIEGIGGLQPSAAATWTSTTAASPASAAIVDEQEDKIHIKAGKLKGAQSLPGHPRRTPAPRNLIIGGEPWLPATTIIDNCALEPEVLDVIAFLSKMGRRGPSAAAAPGSFTVRGVSQLTATEQQRLMPDRIDACVAWPWRPPSTGWRAQPGRRVPWSTFGGGPLEARADGRGVHAEGRCPPGPPGAHAAPDQRDHQPLPRPSATDLQSPIMALSCLADGTSYIRENHLRRPVRPWSAS